MNKLRSCLHNGKKIEMWECAFDKMCKEDQELQEFLKNFEIKMPFEPSLRRYGVSLPPINIKQLYNSIMARGDS